MTSRFLVNVVVFACLLAAGASDLAAHEMGTTRVDVLLTREGTYRVDILVDPEVLVDRLALLEGGSRGTVAAAQRAAFITSKSQLFVQQVELHFDGSRMTPSFLYVPSPERETSADATGIVRLEGRIPPGARAFTMRYALPYTPYLLSVFDQTVPGNPVRQWVEADAASRPFALGARLAPLSRGQAFALYLKLGFTHIIPKGLDHILFVLGIFLLSTSLKRLLAQVTAFTIAHSVTLALSIYEVIRLPAAVVEPVIALSIAYIGVENALTKTVRPWRIALVFAFGLLHGLGFAGVLEELGLPRAEFTTALIAFNVGVELGQLAVIALAFALISSWARRRPWYRRRVVVPLSIAIALIGIYWTIERALA